MLLHQLRGPSGGSGVDGAAQDEKRSVPQMTAKLAHDLGKTGVVGVEVLVNRGTDDHDHRATAGNFPRVAGDMKQILTEPAQQFLGTILEERHLTPFHLVHGVLIYVIDGDLKSGLGKDQPNRQSHSTTPSDHADAPVEAHSKAVHTSLSWLAVAGRTDAKRLRII